MLIHRRHEVLGRSKEPFWLLWLSCSYPRVHDLQWCSKSHDDDVRPWHGILDASNERARLQNARDNQTLSTDGADVRPHRGQVAMGEPPVPGAGAAVRQGC